MSRICVVVPFRAEPDDPRTTLLKWTLRRHWDAHPAWGTVVGKSPPGPFNRAAAILDGAKRTKADILVITDGDVYCPLDDAVANVGRTGYAVPHRLLHRLSHESTVKVLAGEDWRGLPLSTDNSQDSRPYVGNVTGTLVVMKREVLMDVPPDVRFIGWGGEDEAWSCALHTLVGKPWRGDLDLPHLWHEPQPRMNRVVGSHESLALRRRYQHANGNKRAMRALVDEPREPATLSHDNQTQGDHR